LKIEDAVDVRWKKIWLSIPIIVNIAILVFFKYFDFFIESFVIASNTFGVQANYHSLKIILPLGISFYTFQALGYTIDVYRGKISHERDAVAFLAFVTFFPQLVAGPIERATALLPQFGVRRQFSFDNAADGMRQMLWGFFKKIFIADNLAPYVQTVYSNIEDQTGANLVLGTFFFAIQIYADFSGYSDIALGCSRLFGFRLMRNFAYPHFSRSMSERWRRWHISLSSWFKDYLYFPLGGSRVSQSRKVFNTMATFTISGLWHGANWTYVLWGFLNGLFVVPNMLNRNRKKEPDIVAHGRLFPTPREFLQILGTFGLTLISYVFFRAANMHDVISIFRQLMTNNFYEVGKYDGYLFPIVICLSMLILEWFQRERQYALEIENIHPTLRWGIYYSVIILILVYGRFGSNDFIYFQF
jgi:D-alanyl-lipoteichoic acid acyltransferase DltB (MBOAT superfamily)